MTKYDIRKKIYLKQLDIEGAVFVNDYCPEAVANAGLAAGEKLQRIWCALLGHVWDGWIGNANLWCVYCDKQKVEK